jgi:hypothetical protein
MFEDLKIIFCSQSLKIFQSWSLLFIKLLVVATTSNANLPLITTQIFNWVQQLPIIEKTTLLHLLENNITENNDGIPNWQMELGKKEVGNIATNKTVLIEWNEAKK